MKKNKAIVIIGGAIKKTANGKWQTTNFNESDDFGVIGDRLRVIAASYLYKDRPNQIVIACGGRGQRKDVKTIPPIAKVVKQELIELGVCSDDIITEINSNNTYEQLREAGKIIIKEGIIKAVIISNKYHLPRLQAMIKHCPDLAELKKIFAISKLTLKSAEDILIKHNPAAWRKIIAKAYNSAGMKERIKLEKRGVKDIKAGKYKFK